MTAWTELPHAVTQQWLRPLGVESVEARRPGFSGSTVYRCVAPGGEAWALKRWPMGTARSRVEQVHAIVDQARSRGCDLLPAFVSTTFHTSVIVDGGSCWEMAQWLQGQPLSISASAAAISEGAAAIARFHCAAVQAEPELPAPSAAVAARAARLEQLRQELPLALQRKLPESLPPSVAEALERARVCLRQHWPTAAPAAATRLNRWSQIRVRTQYVLRDIHREHLLFTEHATAAVAKPASSTDPPRPNGIIDFDAIRQDNVAVDLARWSGSFAPESGTDIDVLDAAVAGYRRISLLNDQELQLAALLGWTSRWINLANWVVWLVLETRMFQNDEGAIACRVSELTESAARDAAMGWGDR